MVCSVPVSDQGTIQKRTYYFEEAGQDVEFAIFVPSSYRPDKQVPLVVLLHGLFSNPHQVIRYRGIVTEAEKRGYIITAPFGFNDRGWYGIHKAAQWLRGDGPENLAELSERDVLNVLRLVVGSFNVDRKRIFLMGHSMGGAGTLHLGSRYPDIWAGLAPMSPAVPFDIPSLLQPMANLPVMIVTGDKDKITKVEPIRRLVAGLQDFGMHHSYRELKGYGHSAPAWRADIIAEIFDFFDHHRRNEPAPEGFTFRGSQLAEAVSPAQANLGNRKMGQRRSSMATMFRLVAAVSSRTHRLQLIAWSFLYSVTSAIRSVRRFCQDSFSHLAFA